MAKYNHIDHALHNEKVCNYISSKADFGDWIITTAFYWAIHYVRYFMIPVILPDGTTIDCFESLFNNKKCSSEGRHGFQNRYVTTNITAIAIEYKQLHDWCNQARYFEYNQPRALAQQAKDNLKAIKKHIVTNKPIT
jgi:hypothetical protein